MDRFQPFITQNLLTKSFNDPTKVLNENRLQETLLLLPTDGGMSSRLKQRNRKLNLANLEQESGIRHPNYRKINKNSKLALKEFINTSRKAITQAKKIAHENSLSTREELESFLHKNNRDVFDKLPNYQTFLPMYSDLWVNYMREILNIPDNLSCSKNLNINGTNSLLKLSMADFNGSKLMVSKSRNQNMRGLEGIVLWDSQKTFIMITKGSLTDEIKIIPKKGSVFNFQIPINDDEALEYTILGDRFKYRSSDRAGRKFKSRRCDDMLYYIER